MAQTTSPHSADTAADREPIVGVIYNSRSHRNNGRDLDIASRPNVHVAQPKTRQDIRTALTDLAAKNIDFLIINGGDGTVRDVLTCGQAVFEDNWPELAVLPKGKTNALNVDLGAPNGWNLPDAIEAYKNGKRIRRKPVSVAPVEGTEGETMIGFIFGGGAFTLGIQAGQDAHKLGAFNSLAVAATSVWGVAQGLFGNDRNIWRRGTKMRFLIGPERAELPYSAQGDPTRRSVFLVSTLERFPAGMKIFKPSHSGLKLAVLDKPRRRILAMLPAVFTGHTPGWVYDSGFHHVETPEFEIDIEDEYILDGEAYPSGKYLVSSGPELSFVVP